MEWKYAIAELPPLVEPSIHNKELRSELVEVMYEDSTTGFGIYKKNKHRGGWVTREGTTGGLYDIAYQGKRVQMWRPKQ